MEWICNRMKRNVESNDCTITNEGISFDYKVGKKVIKCQITYVQMNSAYEKAFNDLIGANG